MTPKYSVAIPAYNRSDYLRQALESCLRQTVDDFEVIVSDDCSSEDLGAVVRSFGDPRIVYHRSEVRLGATANHQRAVTLSRGTYAITLNSDDLLLPDCLEVPEEHSTVIRRPPQYILLTPYFSMTARAGAALCLL